MFSTRAHLSSHALRTVCVACLMACGSSTPSAFIPVDDSPPGSVVWVATPDNAREVRPGDAHAVASRLHSAVEGSEILVTSDTEVRVRTPSATDRDALLRNLYQAQFGVFSVLDLPEALAISGTGRVQVRTRSGLTDGAGNAVVVRALLGACESLRLVPASEACAPSIEVDLMDETQCVLYCLASTPSLDGSHVQSAEHGPDPYSNTPTVRVALTPEGASRFGEFTGQHIGRPVAIVVDDRVMSAPVVMEAIHGGQVHISFGPTAQGTDEARSLARALSAPHVQHRWSIARSE